MFVTVPDGDVFRGLGCCKRFCIHFESTRRADAKERFKKKKKKKEIRSVGGREEGGGRREEGKKRVGDESKEGKHERRVI